MLKLMLHNSPPLLKREIRQTVMKVKKDLPDGMYEGEHIGQNFKSFIPGPGDAVHLC
jgi:hypothetical protein